MFRKMAAVFLSVLLIVATIPGTAVAVGDTTPPELISVSITKTDLVQGDVLEVVVVAKDEMSGLDTACGIQFNRTDTNADYLGFTGVLSENNPNAYKTNNIIDDSEFQTGEYYIDTIILYDKAGNRIDYSVSDRTLEGTYRFKYTNQSVRDWDPPVLKSLSIDKTSYKVGETIHFSTYATDASLIDSCLVGFYSNNNWSAAPTMSPVPDHPGYFTGTYTVPEYMPQDTYRISVVRLIDYNGNCSNYFVEHNLPVSMECPFQIINSAAPPITTLPVVKDFSITNSVKQGEPIHISVTVDPKGRKLADNPFIMAFYHVGTRTQRCDFSLGKRDGNIFYGDITFPVNWPSGYIRLAGNFTFCDIYGNSGIQATWPTTYPMTCSIQSLYTGTNNCTITRGGQFDPLDGVFAANATEGDMTGRIEVESNVDVSTVGIYLVKYTIKTTLSGQWGAFQPQYYYDFRWVGVTEVTPDPSGSDAGTIAVTNGDVAIGATSDEIALSKDGSAVNYASSVSGTGKYIFTLKDNESKSGKFIIDNSGPETLTSWTGDYPSTFIVSASCKDPAGVAETRWMAGSVPLETIKENGSVFDGSFTVNQVGAYTIYASDKLGNEAFKTINLQIVAVNSVSLNASSIALLTGRTYQLKPSLSPTNCTFKNVLWSSSNPRVATVDANGLVTGVSPGTANIYVKTSSGGKMAYCYVKVSAPVAVSYVAISSTYKTVRIGSAFMLAASARPYNATVKTITWSSSNSKVCTVSSSGYVRAVGVGTAAIYARSNNGKVARCMVYVNPMPVYSVTLNRTSARLAAGSTLQLIATVSPSNATYKTLAWTSSNRAVATVDSTGKITAIARGTAYIYARASNGKYARCLITVQ